MNFFKIFKINKEERKESFHGFSDFFLHASEERKKEVIKEAAERANEEQMEIFNRSRIKIKTR